MTEQIENANDYFLGFTDLLVEAEQERQTFTPDRMLTFGIDALDEVSLGIFPHDLVVIGADSGVGKSELAYNLSVKNAKKGKKVLLFGLEGNINEIAWRYTQREMAKQGVPVETKNYRINVDDSMNEVAKAIYTEVGREGRGENLKIFNKKAVPTMAFIAEMMRKSAEYFDMFVIDHLHYIQYNDNKTENAEISQAMRTLQTLTGELKKPIVLVGHLRKRDLKTDPTKYDLHGSGNIPKEATTVVLLTKMDKRDDNNFSRDHNGGDKNDRFSGTKVILDKSRAGMPVPTKLGGIYDTKDKDYIDKYWRNLNDGDSLAF